MRRDDAPCWISLQEAAEELEQVGIALRRLRQLEFIRGDLFKRGGGGQGEVEMGSNWRRSEMSVGGGG